MVIVLRAYVLGYFATQQKLINAQEKDWHRKNPIFLFEKELLPRFSHFWKVSTEETSTSLFIPSSFLPKRTSIASQLADRQKLDICWATFSANENKKVKGGWSMLSLSPNCSHVEQALLLFCFLILDDRAFCVCGYGRGLTVVTHCPAVMVCAADMWPFSVASKLPYKSRSLHRQVQIQGGSRSDY